MASFQWVSHSGFDIYLNFEEGGFRYSVRRGQPAIQVQSVTTLTLLTLPVFPSTKHRPSDTGIFYHSGIMIVEEPILKQRQYC